MYVLAKRVNVHVKIRSKHSDDPRTLSRLKKKKSKEGWNARQSISSFSFSFLLFFLFFFFKLMKATKAEVVPVETPLNSTRNKHAYVWPIQLQTRLLDRFHPLVARSCSNFPNSRTSATFELAVQCTKGANHAFPHPHPSPTGRIKAHLAPLTRAGGWKKERAENRDTRRLVSFLFSLIFISSNNFTAILSPLIASRCVF